MRLERAALRKPFATVRALIGLFARVNARMDLRILQRLKALLTHIALEGTVARMVHRMQSQLHRPRKRLTAPDVLTLKGLIARVQANVAPQITAP